MRACCIAGSGEGRRRGCVRAGLRLIFFVVVDFVRVVFILILRIVRSGRMVAAVAAAQAKILHRSENKAPAGRELDRTVIGVGLGID